MEKKIVVYTSGTFDLFHIGHLNILKNSKALGDKLVVGVSSDELVASYKKRKPIIPLKDRIEIIKHLDFVDEVIRQDILTNPEDLKAHNVDIVTIGDDWKNKLLPGLEWAKQNGLKVVYLPYTKSTSTSEIKKAIIDGWQEDKDGYFKR